MAKRSRTVSTKAAGTPVDLVLLDMNLPDLHGLDIARRMRAAGLFADIIAITAVRELNIVRSAVATGVVQYLIKPFTFATFADKLTSYRLFREQLASPAAGQAGPGASQSDVDQAFASLRAPSELPLPKGLSASTLESVQDFVKLQSGAVSASEVMALAWARWPQVCAGQHSSFSPRWRAAQSVTVVTSGCSTCAPPAAKGASTGDRPAECNNLTEP